MTQARFLRLANSPFFNLYMLLKLPGAWFMGVRVAQCDTEGATVRVPYGWRSQNPFRSTYFAAQLGAAEMSTGLLVLAAIQGQPAVSMLIVGIQAEFLKKVRETAYFSCSEGAAVQAAVQRALDTGEGQRLQLHSAGRLKDGAEVARVTVEWTIKRKK